MGAFIIILNRIRKNLVSGSTPVVPDTASHLLDDDGNHLVDDDGNRLIDDTV